MPRILSLTDYPDCFRIFTALRNQQKGFESRAVFLDSSLTGKLGRYSIIGWRPYLRLTFDEVLTIKSIEQETTTEEDPLTWLSGWLSAHKKEKAMEDLPLTEGAIGYFSYDFGRKKEGVVTKHAPVVTVPDFILEFFHNFFIEDHITHTLYLVSGDDERSASPEMMEAVIKEAKELNLKTPAKAVGSSISDFTKNEYMDAISSMIRYIIEGDIYVANMTRQILAKSDISPFDFFSVLRKNNPSPFGAYLDYDDFQIICASPERFMQMKDHVIRTRPIKGTRPRGKNPREDALNKAELADSKKDQSELLMIVDLERNDLNRICVPGSVNLKEMFQVETYATVFHLISDIEGKLRPELDVTDLLRAAFPGGSITGAPKLRAMEIVDELEHSLRNIYTGSVGYLSLNGDCDFNIIIRTALYKDGTYHIGAGGGITSESDTEFEYEETDQKAYALLKALGAVKS